MLKTTKEAGEMYFFNKKVTECLRKRLFFITFAAVLKPRTLMDPLSN